MRELTPGQNKINAGLQEQGADFSVDDEGGAQKVLDVALDTLLEKVKSGEGFDAFIEPNLSESENGSQKRGEYSVGFSLDSGSKEQIAILIADFNMSANPPFCYVKSLNVMPIALRKGFGIGSVLLKRVEEDAYKFGCDHVELWAEGTEKVRHPYKFYKKAGYETFVEFSEEEINDLVADNLGFRMYKKLQ